MEQGTEEGLARRWTTRRLPRTLPQTVLSKHRWQSSAKLRRGSTERRSRAPLAALTALRATSATWITHACDILPPLPMPLVSTTALLTNRFFDCFPGIGYLGAFAILVIIAKPAGVRLLAFLTEFCSHFTPLLNHFQFICSFLLERFQVSGDVVDRTAHIFVMHVAKSAETLLQRRLALRLFSGAILIVPAISQLMLGFPSLSGYGTTMPCLAIAAASQRHGECLRRGC